MSVCVCVCRGGGSNSELQSVSGSLVHVNRRHGRGALKTEEQGGGRQKRKRECAAEKEAVHKGLREREA